VGPLGLIKAQTLPDHLLEMTAEARREADLGSRRFLVKCPHGFEIRVPICTIVGGAYIYIHMYVYTHAYIHIYTYDVYVCVCVFVIRVSICTTVGGAHSQKSVPSTFPIQSRHIEDFSEIKMYLFAPLAGNAGAR
jgi:hypothetical protein